MLPTPSLIPFMAERTLNWPPAAAHKEERKEDFGDFFKVNIYDIFRYKPVPAETNEPAEGKSAGKYTLALNEPELATFSQADIIRYGNGNYDLVFSSEINEVNEDVKAFIDFCVQKLGPDFMHKEAFTASDAQDALLGVFSRVWYNEIRIDNVYFTLTLTLFDITPETF
jgi:hypothetical protein